MSHADEALNTDKFGMVVGAGGRDIHEIEVINDSAELVFPVPNIGSSASVYLVHVWCPGMKPLINLARDTFVSSMPNAHAHAFEALEENLDLLCWTALTSWVRDTCPFFMDKKLATTFQSIIDTCGIDAWRFIWSSAPLSDPNVPASFWTDFGTCIVGMRRSRYITRTVRNILEVATKKAVSILRSPYVDQLNNLSKHCDGLVGAENKLMQTGERSKRSLVAAHMTMLMSMADTMDAQTMTNMCEAGAEEMKFSVEGHGRVASCREAPETYTEKAKRARYDPSIVEAKLSPDGTGGMHVRCDSFAFPEFHLSFTVPGKMMNELNTRVDATGCALGDSVD